MDSGLRARRGDARVKLKTGFERFNAIEMLLFGLIAVAVVDCAVIAWLIVRGFGD